MQQFYRETMEVTDEVKSDTADDSKTTSLDNSGTEEVAAVTDTNDIDMKTEEGCDIAVITELLMIVVNVIVFDTIDNSV